MAWYISNFNTGFHCQNSCIKRRLQMAHCLFCLKFSFSSAFQGASWYERVMRQHFIKSEVQYIITSLNHTHTKKEDTWFSMGPRVHYMKKFHYMKNFIKLRFVISRFDYKPNLLLAQEISNKFSDEQNSGDSLQKFGRLPGDHTFLSVRNVLANLCLKCSK